jgi:hypothetical protein
MIFGGEEFSTTDIDIGTVQLTLLLDGLSQTAPPRRLPGEFVRRPSGKIKHNRNHISGQ